jgi:hypothetical protein
LYETGRREEEESFMGMKRIRVVSNTLETARNPIEALGHFMPSSEHCKILCREILRRAVPAVVPRS